jgi:polyisoprenoid-binding protein YceI
LKTLKTYVPLCAILVGLGVALNGSQSVSGLQAGSSQSGGGAGQTSAPPGGTTAPQPQGAPAAPARAPLQTFDTTRPAKLDIVEASARYRVQEQLVGINFMSDAVGRTDAVTGTLVLGPDGAVGTQSKIVVDLRTLTSDQEMRDNYIRTRTLETDKFPLLEFVPRRVQGLPTPLPSPPQAQALGFQIVGDMTLHGVTKEAVWSAVATLRGATIAGRATATVLFSDFKIPKPSVPLLLSADEKIQLEVEFKMNRSAL